MITRKNLICAALVAFAFVATAPRADAVTILVFGQTSGSNTITGTATGGVSTTITGTDVAVAITFIENGAPTTGFFNFTATSTSAATLVSGFVTQHFAGSFTITSGAGGTGTNYLSGSFSDAVFGAGASLTLSAAQPPDSVSFTSDVITSLGGPRGVSLSFTNVTPPVGIDGSTLASFTASVSGNFSGNVIPEPSTLVLLGMGVMSMGGYALRRRRARAQA